MALKHASLRERRAEPQKALNAMIGNMACKNKALVALVEVMHNKILELNRELTRPKTLAGILGTLISNWDVLKPKEFTHSRDTKDINNLLWGMAQYYQAMGIDNKLVKLWARLELQRQGLQDSIHAMAMVESLVELKKDMFESPECQRSRLSMEASKEVAGNDSSSKDEVDERNICQRRGKTKIATRKFEQKSLSSFLCNGQHRVKEYPMSKAVSHNEVLKGIQSQK
ncbi:hypothetical protein GOBAR_AA06921 [Gossypium barbadense]|uniref:Uncharacterized protein n=1 Tax=Gossypium barbadense TaxID=3634 RepID=A0A2P5YDL9_GOSBA|nr:hypothetical protein GOBAR_AA06921 [Gossypium barbadense]